MELQNLHLLIQIINSSITILVLCAGFYYSAKQLAKLTYEKEPAIKISAEDVSPRGVFLIETKKHIIFDPIFFLLLHSTKEHYLKILKFSSKNSAEKSIFGYISGAFFEGEKFWIDLGSSDIDSLVDFSKFTEEGEFTISLFISYQIAGGFWREERRIKRTFALYPKDKWPKEAKPLFDGEVETAFLGQAHYSLIPYKYLHPGNKKRLKDFLMDQLPIPFFKFREFIHNPTIFENKHFRNIKID